MDISCTCKKYPSILHCHAAQNVKFHAALLDPKFHFWPSEYPCHVSVTQGAYLPSTLPPNPLSPVVQNAFRSKFQTSGGQLCFRTGTNTTANCLLTIRHYWEATRESFWTTIMNLLMPARLKPSTSPSYHIWRWGGGDVEVRWRWCGGDVEVRWWWGEGDVEVRWWWCGGDVEMMWRWDGGEVEMLIKNRNRNPELLGRDEFYQFSHLGHYYVQDGRIGYIIAYTVHVYVIVYTVHVYVIVYTVHVNVIF